ncbi:CTB family bacteriocin [Calothrix sp. PCC 6303]|uniref:CTB family bacteriocin n=1 Tax=Calothrix sp. PCC 6303 TaxID=1170562 RepID=UPI0002A04EA8|nr:CTB family bacteriocin [Calothrix sp. PCC 6303]AFZ02121.1 hypothetical protein Cal6303_3180 [Calothrix sp. PCC 6303]
MSHEIKNEAIELSTDELDVVNGGAASLFEFGSFSISQNSINSALIVGPGGVVSGTQVTDLNIDSFGEKFVQSF